MLHDSSYVIFWKRHNYRDNKTDGWLPGGGEGSDKQVGHMGNFQAVKPLRVILDTHQYTFVQTHRMSDAKSEP